MFVISSRLVKVQGILKSHSKDIQPSLEKLGITFPAPKFSFIFKVTEKFRSHLIDMQGSILFVNTGRISQSLFCNSKGLLLTSIIFTVL